MLQKSIILFHLADSLSFYGIIRKVINKKQSKRVKYFLFMGNIKLNCHLWTQIRKGQQITDRADAIMMNNQPRVDRRISVSDVVEKETLKPLYIRETYIPCGNATLVRRYGLTCSLPTVTQAKESLADSNKSLYIMCKETYSFPT